MKLGVKSTFQGLLIVTGCIAIWLSALFITQWVSYLRLSDHVKGEVIEWSTVAEDDTHHYVALDYRFMLNGKQYTAHHIFQKPVYASAEAATFAKESIETPRVDVWYAQGRDGKPISTVGRLFPFNEMVRLAIALSIFFYFLFFRRYAAQFASV